MSLYEGSPELTRFRKEIQKMNREGIVWNTTELDTFWRFVYERHSIWNRRFIQQLPRSAWTQDEVLGRNKFTNIYRELDPGTVYCRENILERIADRDYSVPLSELPSRADVIFNVMLYRLMCSIPTYSGFGFRRLDQFDEHDLDEYLRDIYNTGQPVFGNAYLISPYSSMGSEYKFRNVSRLFGLVQRRFDTFFRRLDTAPTFEKAFKVINLTYGFGPFLAYQVMVDLTYPLPNTKYGSAIIPFSQNDWAKLGPGAIRGFSRVSKSYNKLLGLKWLQVNQRSEFARLGLDFPYLVEHREDGTSVEVEISLANLQNCFCEYHKYRSIQDGTGKSQRIYVSSVTASGEATGRTKWNVYTGRYE